MKSLFQTIKTEGALLPADLLHRVAAEDKSVPGLTPAAYHRAGNEKLNEAVTRSWTRLLGAWSAFRPQLEREGPRTAETRERWLSILFQELDYGRLHPAQNLTIEDKLYPISHMWGKVPIHLLGAGVDLDRRSKGVEGAAQSSPHSLVQEFLNRSDDHLWAILSNGRLLRLLRDNLSMTRQAYLEFDLEAMMEGEAYADFRLLWLVCHQSRLEDDPCWLERWSQLALDQGKRALETLRGGVQKAIETLGRAFRQHRDNGELRRRLESGELTAREYYGQLLRLVYRLLFLFVAEDRGLLTDPWAPAEARDRYQRFYSCARLRALAERRRGTRHGDLWVALQVVMQRLGTDAGCPELALYPLGSFLWRSDCLSDLAGCQLANHDLLEAIRHLATTQEKSVRRRVDYRNLGPEELGSVYESLLELEPDLSKSFELRSLSGSERKTTGSYYTPPELVRCLLDSALDPVVAECQGNADALLRLKVCDPACGSGHFLLAAAHRLAHHLAVARTGESEPAPTDVRRALRDVIGNCLYGVDVNPMAVELCKVSLWIECLEPTRPLSFLENKILCGNSLFGTTPALVRGGIPDEAFVALKGDDKKRVSALKKRNAQERKGYVQLELGPVTSNGSKPPALDSVDDARIDGIHRKEELYRAWLESPGYQREKAVCDAWCAAFFVPKTEDTPAITQEVVARLQAGEKLSADVLDLIRRTATESRFFHWHVEFPDVFAPDGSGGFDVVLGNPPWERMKIQEKEWFASRSPWVAEAKTASERAKRIKQLEQDDPELYARFQADLRQSEAESVFLHSSGRYPLCGRGDINTYAVFAETNRMLMGPGGRTGFIVPPGIATDHTTQHFFSDLVTRRQLGALYTFENEERLFPGIDHRVNFSLVTLAGADRPVPRADLVWFARRAEHLEDPARHFSLSPEDLERLNPNTRTCPIFRSRRDADLNLAIYRRVPVLWREGPPEENPWGLKFMAMLHMANDSGLFREEADLLKEGCTRQGNRFERDRQVFVPLYEAKMLHHFDHRFGTYEGQTQAQANMGTLPGPTPNQYADPGFEIQPRYWVDRAEVEARLKGRWERGWLLGWRDICRSTDTRTVIASLLPRVAVGHTTPLMLSDLQPGLVVCLYANLCSFVLDYCARQKVGGTHLTYSYLKQLPVLPPGVYQATCPWSPSETIADWMLPKVLELTYTAHDLEPFARDVGYAGPPFRWDEERRFELRCQLDAAFFHLYGLSHDDAAYVMDTFPILRRDDEKAHRSYRTKDRVLELLTELSLSIREGSLQGG